MILVLSRLVQKLPLRPKLTSIPTNSMKIHSLALAGAFVQASAWMPNIASKHNTLLSIVHQKRTTHQSPVQKVQSQLHSTFTPEGIELPTPLVPTGNTIADGTVVSIFRGGFAAIRIKDDIDEAYATPQVVDTTGKLPKSFKMNSLGGDLIGHQVVFNSGQTGVIVTHRPPIVFVYTGDDEIQTMDGSVEILDSLAKVSVPDDLRSVDCFGTSLLGKSSSQKGAAADAETKQRAIFSPIPQVKDIKLINSPLITGVTMFDALAPIGKGQNMLLIGDDVEDMRGYVCDFLSIQAKRTRCVYASTQDNDKALEMLQKFGLQDDVITVSRTSGADSDKISQAAEATMVAATACSIAESFALEKGEDTLVIVDNIDQHKKLWDATTRVLVDVFGIESVVKSDRDGGASSEMRAFFSSLIQRSAAFKVKRGGGSVTLLLLTTIPRLSVDDDSREFTADDFKDSPAKIKDRIQLLTDKKVPLTTATLRKIQIPIPSDSEGMRRLSLQHVDDLISMSDGQIWLDEELKKSGRQPPMDFQRSVTRIGIGADTESRADAAAIRRVVEGLRLDLSQAEHMEGAEMGAKSSVKQVKSAKSWLLAMHQPPLSHSRSLSESIVVLLAASKGHLGDFIDKGYGAGTKEGEDLIANLVSHVKANAVNAMEEIDSTQDLTPESTKEIENAIKGFLSSSL
ncbi:unnamed protein product [Cylindrotheca closterium]|uniref:ATPase F1/V1/A1 complex alpha/beta subunit nucleotide-binding domain-containing protein n=1 Tax=Cylindrotheca closterium TaxID=2856 RepID=A0AAD2CQ48_9STRA|nr:unnamed protein product [Cylindrotheca closterium]